MSEGNIEFRKVPADPNHRGIKRKLSMIQSFASALASRNINNKKINKPIKQLRVLSCFGNRNIDGVLPPCEHLMESQTGEGKLDYPKVGCPLQMPGFSNYIVSGSDESEEPVTRKYYIENMDYQLVQRVPVQIGDKPEKSE